MPNVEGLWCFQTASVDEPEKFETGGVVVLETGRVLGGDSALAYVGDYQVDGPNITGVVRSYQWNPAYEVENVFGMKSPDIDYKVDLQGQCIGDLIIGHISPQGHPELALPIQMLLMSRLP
jgi:hypothetical protein